MNITAVINGSLRWLQTRGVQVVRPQIRRTLKHDPKAFTQGLAYVDGFLYESTGGYEESSIRRLSLETGETLECVPVNGQFAEDIAYLNGQLYQLTWQDGFIYQYHLMPIRLVGRERVLTEGWGLASHQRQLIVSDGSHKLRILNERLQVVREVSVRRWSLPFRHFNALEAVGNSLYANIWYTTLIAEIDLVTEQLVRIIDCHEIQRIEAPHNSHHILNGIAYIPSSGSFILTGKHWRQMYDVVWPPN